MLLPWNVYILFNNSSVVFIESILQILASYLYDNTKPNLLIRDGYIFTKNGKGKTEIVRED